jgi:hypothetical protein
MAGRKDSGKDVTRCACGQGCGLVQRMWKSSRFRVYGRAVAVDTFVSGFIVLLLTYSFGGHADFVVTLLSTVAVVVVFQLLRNALERCARLLLDSADMEQLVSEQTLRPQLLDKLKDFHCALKSALTLRRKHP